MIVEVSDRPFISFSELGELIERPDVKLFDVRGGWGSETEDSRMDYTAGHIPGAIFLDWRTEFIELGKERNLASVASYEEALASFKAFGISTSDTVILYDDYHHMQAGRMWWAMSYWGFKNVYILEGGLKYWLANGGTLSRKSHAPSKLDEKLVFKPKLTADYKRHLADVETSLTQIHLVDARGPLGYNGDPENPRSGHIPTAIHISYLDVLDQETGLFKSKDDLRRLFGSRLKDYRGKPIISSCGSGYAGTVVILALLKIGISAPLYDGSFSEWKQNSKRPVVQGPSPT